MNKTRSSCVSPELGLIALCARNRPEDLDREEIRALARTNLKWPQLPTLMVWHGVLPIVYRNLNLVCPDLLPRDVKITLELLRRKTSVLNHFLTSELLRLLDRFQAADIPCLPFKGPVLAIAAYGNIHSKQFSDLDILVRTRDFARVEEILVEDDYRGDRTLTGFRKSMRLYLDRELTFVRGDRIFQVDVHTGPGPRKYRFGRSFEDFYRNAGTVRIGEMPVTCLGAEDHVILLCHHGARHRWKAFRLVCDLGEFIRSHENLNWDMILHAARSLRSERVVRVALQLVHDVLGVPLPPEVLHFLSIDQNAKYIALRLLAGLLDTGYPSPGAFSRARIDLELQEGIANRLHTFSLAPLFNYRVREIFGL